MSLRPQLVSRLRLLSRRGWPLALALIATAFVFMAVIGVQIDASDYRNAVGQWLSGKLSRPVAVQGTLRLTLGLEPALKVQGLRIGQPAGFGDGDLMRIGELQVNLDLRPLWHCYFE
mgnify:CR=1 FL=1